jgi:hypothetical protein
MRILLWHVHGGWTDAFVRGEHDYLFPTDAARGPWGLGRGGRDWPANAIEVSLDAVRDADVDVVVLQRLEEIDLAERALGCRLGHDVPAVFLEHNTPKPDAAATRHPLADRAGITIVHVTHFNELMWDNGRGRTVVIEHGIPDPGYRYTGSVERMAVVVNEPVRRWRITGTDLLPRFAGLGVDAFGMAVEALPEALGAHRAFLRPVGDLGPELLRDALPERRLYLHLPRWTSLGLSLLEAMHLGMPVVVLQATEAARAVPPGAGFLSTNVSELVAAARLLLDDPDAARRSGEVARQAALERYGLTRFLRDWDALLVDVEEHHRRTRRRIPAGAAGTTYGRSSDAYRDGL